MAVRIKVEIVRGKNKVKTNALVNSGYETEEPELLIPVNLAKRLKIYPKLLPNTTIEIYSTAGENTQMYFTPKCVKVRAITPDRISKEILCDLSISESEKEVLLSDCLSEKLGIMITNLFKGF